jgi:UDP-N-acetyl-D-mannosaminuronate dehydrogenase
VAREYGRHTRFIELAGEINTRMPEHDFAKQEVSILAFMGAWNVEIGNVPRTALLLW